MEKRSGGGDIGGVGVLCLLCAGVLACLLPQSFGAADPTWHANPRGHDGAIVHHAGLSPVPAPPPTAGADLPPMPSRAPKQAAPHFGFPLQPMLGSAPPPSAGEGYPFIGSNPMVPLPTGMTDTATVLPLPDAGDGTATKVVGFAASVRVQVSMIGLVIFFAIFVLSTS